MVTESFANLTPADKERTMVVTAFIVFQGFFIRDPTKKIVVTMLDDSEGRMNFINILSVYFNRDAVLYFTENLWDSTVRWVNAFPFLTEPMTYTKIEQYVRTHPMFQGDKWEQTATKVASNLTTIDAVYPTVLQYEPLLKKTLVPDNRTIERPWKKRAHYLQCALARSTSHSTFQTALLEYGFDATKHDLYVKNVYLYRRLFEDNRIYSDERAKTLIENRCFIYYQWERLIDAPSAVLDALPDRCENAPLQRQIPDLSNDVSSGGETVTIVQIPNMIPVPPLKTITKPTIQVPTLVPGLPSDAVPWVELDTKKERRLFFGLMWVFLGLGLYLFCLYLCHSGWGVCGYDDDGTGIDIDIKRCTTLTTGHYWYRI
jgi:hypothetical protein